MQIFLDLDDTNDDMLDVKLEYPEHLNICSPKSSCTHDTVKTLQINKLKNTPVCRESSINLDMSCHKTMAL